METQHDGGVGNPTWWSGGNSTRRGNGRSPQGVPFF